MGDDLVFRVAGAVHSAPLSLTPDEMAVALSAHLWFLQRASGGGIELTAAGYLKPADVEAASTIIPVMADWIGANSRETHTVPVLHFRESLQQLGLLRKYKGKLLLTRAGASAPATPNDCGATSPSGSP